MDRSYRRFFASGFRRRRNTAVRCFQRSSMVSSYRKVNRIRCRAVVSERLQTLKTLIPSGESTVKVDLLFQRTADYILQLRSQVAVLQELVQIYESCDTESRL